MLTNACGQGEFPECFCQGQDFFNTNFTSNATSFHYTNGRSMSVFLSVCVSALCLFVFFLSFFCCQFSSLPVFSRSLFHIISSIFSAQPVLGLVKVGPTSGSSWHMAGCDDNVEVASNLVLESQRTYSRRRRNIDTRALVVQHNNKVGIQVSSEV